MHGKFSGSFPDYTISICKFKTDDCFLFIYVYTKGHNVVILGCLEDEIPHKQFVSEKLPDLKCQEKIKKVIACGSHKNNKPHMLMY